MKVLEHENTAINSDGVLLVSEGDGEGPLIVGLHGLTATHRYVVMGSRFLSRNGYRFVTYDARGHGLSSPALNSHEYGYEILARDLTAVLDHCAAERAIIAGASMGAHTAVRFALDQPERVAGLCLITPAFEPGGLAPDRLAHYDALAAGLENGGVDGFIAAYDLSALPEKWRSTVVTVLQQRMSAHAHPQAVADALRVVPRSHVFESWDQLAEITQPAVVVGSRDEADPEHPYAIAQQYAQALPNAQLRVEEPGKSPLAWQGGQLSRVIAELAVQ